MKKILNYIIIFLLLFTLSGCVEPESDKPDIIITNITINQETIPNEIVLDEFNLSDIKLKIYKSDGSVTQISIDESMLSDVTLESLKGPGQKIVGFLYEGYRISFNLILTEEVEITNVTLAQETVPLEIAIDEFNLSDIKLMIAKSDGSVSYLPINESMLSQTMLESLNSIGQKDIAFTYLGFTITFSITLTEDDIVEPLSPYVNLIAINDTHGAFHTEGENIGFEKLNTLIKTLENDNGDYIKIANGDIFQGTYISNIYRGLPMIEALNLMDFDAFVIGNHEFDWGIDEIAKYADGNISNGEADFPFLACNIIDTKTNKTLPWTKDYTIIRYGGYKVGIIGAIGQYLESSISSDKVSGYEFIDPVPLIKNIASNLRTNLGCDLVIVSIHEYEDETNSRLAALTGNSRIDAIINGHTHQNINNRYKRNDNYNIPAIQSGTKNYSAATITFTLNENKTLTNAQTKSYSLSTYLADQDLLTLIAKYQEDINRGNQVVTYTPEYLSRSRIGYEMTQAMKEKYNADVAIINTGGVRNDLKVGNITVSNIFDVFPFDNVIITTTMKGSQLSSLYNQHQDFLYFNKDFKSSSINSTKTYTVVTIDYVFTGSYYHSQFSGSVGNNTNVLMRDVLIEYWGS